MNVSRINYLFAEPGFFFTYELYQAVLTAACKSASQKAKGYDESLAHFTNAFDLDDLVSQMPVVESVTGQLKPKHSLVDTITALRFLHDAGYLDVEDNFRSIQLETHLFKMIAEAWATSMGVRAFTPIRSDEPIYAVNPDRATHIGEAQAARRARLQERREVVAA